MTSEIDDILRRSFLRASDFLAVASPAKPGSPAPSLGSKKPVSGVPHLAAEEPNPRMPHLVSKEMSQPASIEPNSGTPRLGFKVSGSGVTPPISSKPNPRMPHFVSKEPSIGISAVSKEPNLGTLLLESGSGVTSPTPTKPNPRMPHFVSKEASIGSSVVSKEPNLGTLRSESGSGVTPPTPTKPDPCAGLIQLFRRRVFTDDDDASAGGRATCPETAGAQLRALLPVYDERARLVGYLTRGAHIAPPACPSGSHPHPFRPPVFVDVRKLVPRTGCSAECSTARYVSLLTNVNPKAVWVPSKALKEAAQH